MWTEKDIIDFVEARGYFISPEAVKAVLKHQSPEEVLLRIISAMGDQVVITEDMVDGGGGGSPPAERGEVPASELSAENRSFEVLKSMERSTSCGDVSHFAAYFKDRFHKLRKILRGNAPVMRGAVPISSLSRLEKGEEVKLVGIVMEVSTRLSKKGNYSVILEDESGTVKVFVNRAEEIIEDEVIGILGRKMSGNAVYAERVIRPGMLKKEIAASDTDEYCIFISDIHIGNRTFLEHSWEAFIKWLSGEERWTKYEIARKTRYLVITGDLVDGVGIYPSQEEELEIPDLYEQFRVLGEYLERLPENITIVVQPGNHDPVRGAEPQPPIPEEFWRYFPENTRFVSNPAYVKLDGRTVLSYHGRSFDDLVPKFKSSYENAVDIMRKMLMRRHLAPLYGFKTQLAPEKYDHMVIDPVPDIFVTGHSHTFGVAWEMGVLLINGSTWQDQTSYQEMYNITPTPGYAVAVHLGSMKPYKLRFT